jgi:hypothetical protein
MTSYNRSRWYSLLLRSLAARFGDFTGLQRGQNSPNEHSPKRERFFRRSIGCPVLECIVYTRVGWFCALHPSSAENILNLDLSRARFAATVGNPHGCPPVVRFVSQGASCGFDLFSEIASCFGFGANVAVVAALPHAMP